MKQLSILILIIFIISCNSGENGKEMLFTKLPSSATNIDFINQLQDNGKLNIIEYLYYYNGGGVAVGDINNDGKDDIFFTANEGSNKLYLNLGDFKFKDITKQAGVNIKGDWSTGVTMADVNNDGYLDIYVSELSEYKGIKGYNKLFINNGDLTFSENAKELGLDFAGYSTQAAFFDKDLDGDLDLYLLNNSVHSLHSYGKADLRNTFDSLAGDRIFENQLADIGKFVDVTKTSGIYSSAIGYGLGLAIADVDIDGYPDIFVSNDFHENDYLYINNGDGTFSEKFYQYATYSSRYSMGNDIGDINNDGRPDIITLDMLPSDPEILLKSVGEDKQDIFDIKMSYGYDYQFVRNTLQVNQNGLFSDVAQLTGLHATDWSWAPLMADFDGDGLKDIFISNGIYKRPNDLNYIQYLANLGRNNVKGEASAELIKRMPTLKISNYMFHNSENLKFQNVAKEWGLDEPSYSNGAAYTDLDNDGDLDLIINNINQKAFIYRNNKENHFPENHYVKIKLAGLMHNKFGLGARVEIFQDGHMQAKEMQLTRGFQSSVPPYLYFGLGKEDIIDSIRVIWSKKNMTVIKNVPVDQSLEILEEGGKLFKKSREEKQQYVTLPFKHQENVDYQDYKYEFLLPYRLSREGPALAVGDINNDGKEDVFVGGAKNQSATFFLQENNGNFKKFTPDVLLNDLTYEDVDATFFDANGDNKLDLYVVSGGGDVNDGDPLFQDRLYIQTEDGWAKQMLPKIASNGSCVRAADIDNDGDQDLFIGTRSIPGGYGYPATQYLLENDGNAEFTDVTAKWSHDLLQFGMVTDAVWVDIDNDSDNDLIVVAEWEPVSVFINNNKRLINKTSSFNLSGTSGWWRSIEATDINNDGFIDLIVGNFGMNNKIKATTEQPVELYLADFDQNGRPEPILFYYQENQKIPLKSKDDLARQMPLINRTFTNYSAYAKVRSLEDLLAGHEEELMMKKEARTFESGILINKKGESFEWQPFSGKAQWSVINDILALDNNIIVGGNTNSNFVELGNQDAFTGVLRIEDHHNKESEFINLNSRYVDILKRISISGKDHVIIISNNDSLRIYPFESFSSKGRN